MKYIGNFKDIENNSCTIEIISNNDDTSTRELILGDSPIITEVESDEIFKPVKCSSATIKVVLKDIIPDVYSSKAHGTKVNFYVNNVVKWVGYITPNMYNLDYNTEIENLELECIDGLSTLQYIDFECTSDKFVSITNLIRDLIGKCGCYEAIYLPTNLSETEVDDGLIFDMLSISEYNFVDEDEDEPKKCDEVLEEICKYFGLTAIAEGNEVYFLDYEGFGNILTSKYQRIDKNSVTSTTLYNNKTIISDIIAASKTQVSLEETYNKIKVICELNSVDDLIPDIEDKKLLTNKNGRDWQEYRKIPYTPNKVYFDAFYKFYNHPNFKCFNYIKDAYAPGGWGIIWDADVKTYDDLDKYIGGNIIKCYAHKEEKDNKLIPSLDWQTFIYLDMRNSQYVPKQDPPLPENIIRKFVEVDLNKQIAFNSRYAYIILDGSVDFCTKNLHCPITGEEADGNDSFNKENLYIEAILECNGKYFSNANTDNIDGGEWVDYEVPFKIYLDCNDDETSSLFNKNWNIKSNIDYTLGLEATSGFAIKLPDTISTYPPKLTLIGLRQPILKKPDSVHRPITGIWISGLSMNLEMAYQNSDDSVDADSDTSYENVIDEDFVNEHDDETFKICTWDNKQANYSALIYNDEKYLDTMYYKPTGETCRAEEHYINRMIRHYSIPHYKLNITLKNILRCFTLLSYNIGGMYRHFMVDSQSINWRYNTNELTLIEI